MVGVPMPSTLLIQSFRTEDVPGWVTRCQDSVRAYAGAQGWDYRFEGDALFARAPDWVRAGGSANVCGLSDICRLEWMVDALREYDRVVWADIDLLVIDPACITLPDADYGLAHERISETGHSVNNAFMFFTAGAPMLRTYLDRCYEILRAGGGPDGCDRTAIGPGLLASLDVPQSHVIGGLDILNTRDLLGLSRKLDRLPEGLARLGKYPLGAANLCLNERSYFHGDERRKYDQLLDMVSAGLLAMSGGAGV